MTGLDKVWYNIHGAIKLRTVINFIINFGIIELFSVFLAATNALTFALYGLDKHRAVKNKWRVSENCLIFFTLIFGGIGAFFGMIFLNHKKAKTKFKVFAAIGLVIVTIPLIHIAHGLTLDRIIRYAEIDFHSENWPAEMNGYRIAFMTDMHVITDETMAEVVAELNEKNIDLLLLGGDFSMGNAHYQGTVREISQTITADGIFGVEGNHDYHIRLFTAMEQYGIIPLDNSSQRIQPGFYVAGVRDMWNGNFDLEKAMQGANTEDFILLVSHNPDFSMTQPTAGIDLILSGHTHGGQITFFGRPFYLLRGSITDYGTRFAHGFAESAEGVPVFASSGVGPYYSLPRIFARPEVVVLTMYRE
jgi:predicted MPP superfamily phosphohydrolase